METEPPPARLCPNCRQPVAVDRTICPHCGASIPTVWPPPPDGATAPHAPPVRLLTGTRGGDIAAGIAAGSVLPAALEFILAALHFLPDETRGMLQFLAALLPLGLYGWAQPRYPLFARSLGWTILAWVLVPLGVVAVCIVVKGGP